MNRHHIWCNFFMRPREGCDICNRFFRDYPYEGLTGHETVAKYFPEAIPLSPDDGVKLTAVAPTKEPG